MNNKIIPKPINIYQMTKSYISDLNRIWNMSREQLKKHQDKQFKKIVKYAYTVPLYYNKYKKNGINPMNIKGIQDIKKLPFITKDDLRENYPNKIIPSNFNKNENFLISTSGSTGKPVFIYVDLISAIKNLICSARIIKAYGGNWNKSKIAIIIDTSPGSIEHATYTDSALPILKKFLPLKNIKHIDIAEKTDNIIKELNEFNPEFFGSDPNMLRKLAILRNEGMGQDINPKYIFSSSSMLDEYTRKYVEKAFDTKIFDNYFTTEAGGIGFECKKCGCYHIFSDYIFLEVLDEEYNQVPYGQQGHTVFTKLYGGGTPIIRYTGIDDIVIPIEQASQCGITSQMIKQIEGRSTDLIILPSGKPMSPLTVTDIPAKTMKHFETYKIKQFQIIQHKKDEIEILIVIDKKLRNIGVPVNELLQELKKRFTDRIGHGINIIVNETNEIQKDVRADYVKVVISKVKNKSSIK